MPPVPRAQHPAITGIGIVDQHNGQTHVRGWTLGPCPARCPCHRHPLTGQLVASQDQQRGLLGLAQFAPVACPCCTPWTPDELRGVLRDLYDFSTLATA